MSRCIRANVATLLLTLFAGCGGTVVSVHTPPLPEPGPTRFETFEQWDARVNAPATTQATEVSR